MSPQHQMLSLTCRQHNCGVRRCTCSNCPAPEGLSRAVCAWSWVQCLHTSSAWLEAQLAWSSCRASWHDRGLALQFTAYWRQTDLHHPQLFHRHSTINNTCQMWSSQTWRYGCVCSVWVTSKAIVCTQMLGVEYLDVAQPLHARHTLAIPKNTNWDDWDVPGMSVFDGVPGDIDLRQSVRGPLHVDCPTYLGCRAWFKGAIWHQHLQHGRVENTHQQVHHEDTTLVRACTDSSLSTWQRPPHPSHNKCGCIL